MYLHIAAGCFHWRSTSQILTYIYIAAGCFSHINKSSTDHGMLILYFLFIVWSTILPQIMLYLRISLFWSLFLNFRKAYNNFTQWSQWRLPRLYWSGISESSSRWCRYYRLPCSSNKWWSSHMHEFYKPYGWYYSCKFSIQFPHFSYPRDSEYSWNFYF